MHDLCHLIKPALCLSVTLFTDFQLASSGPNLMRTCLSAVLHLPLPSLHSNISVLLVEQLLQVTSLGGDFQFTLCHEEEFWKSRSTEKTVDISWTTKTYQMVMVMSTSQTLYTKDTLRGRLWKKTSTFILKWLILCPFSFLSLFFFFLNPFDQSPRQRRSQK